MNHTATEVQAMVRNMDKSKEKYAAIKESDPDQYLRKLEEENKTLVEFYPAVFALHADNKLDETFFYMLKEKRKMERGETNEDDASVRVGQKLFQRWVAPVISNVPTTETMSYSEYYKSLERPA